MRPWLMLPLLLPGLWAGITFAALWPADAPVWLLHPLTPAALAITGIIVAWFMEQVRSNPRRVSRRGFFARLFEPKLAEETDEPIVTEPEPWISAPDDLIAFDDSQPKWRFTPIPTDALHVGMPQTATPAPGR